ncbi:MAG: hypothetical protein IAF38_01810 [Bacteroidia bacterium]|nr:hypothetical protein [Bacteroidia bacterium]
MKQKSFKISIAHPCTQSWDEMEQKENGRYCSHCTKVVIDFTGMSDSQIAAELYKQKKLNGGPVCGRVDRTKLNSTVYYSANKPFQFNYSLLRYSLAGLLTFSAVKSFGQTTTTKKENIVLDNSGLKKGTPAITQNTKTTKGKTVFTIKVKDEESGKNIKSFVEISGAGITYQSKGSIHQISVPDSLMGQTIIINADSKKHYSESKEVILTPAMNKTIFIKLDKRTKRRNHGAVMGMMG